MHIICLGLSHNTATVEIRERYAVPEAELGHAISCIKAIPYVRETVLVSTCNRVELYAAVDRNCMDFSEITDFFRKRGQIHEEDRGMFFRYLMPESVQHLFRVVSGLDSMVIGETEILGQVKKAYSTSSELGGTGKYLNRLFQNAFKVAKQVRSESNITRGTVSVGSAAVDLAEQLFGNLAQRKVMIIGAGDMGERTARSLMSRGVKSVLVSNRSHERAEALAAEMGGRAIRFEEWDQEFMEVDILISSTSAPHPILTKAKLEPIMRKRMKRSLFLIDIAVPRDVEPDVNELEGVYLYDIDSLSQIAHRSLEIRRKELGLCERMIADHVADYESWVEAQQLDAETRKAMAQRKIHLPVPHETAVCDGSE